VSGQRANANPLKAKVSDAKSNIPRLMVANYPPLDG